MGFSLKGLTIFAKTRQTLGVAGKASLLHTEIPSTGKLVGPLSQPPTEQSSPGQPAPALVLPWCPRPRSHSASHQISAA